MVGTSIPSRLDYQRHPRVLSWRNGRWVHAVEPLHENSKFMGPGRAFGVRMADFVSQHDKDVCIGLVPCGVSGTSIRDWFPGQRAWDEAVEKIREALESGGKLKGILWQHGVSDCGTMGARAYEDSLHKLCRRFRSLCKDKKVPFLIGQMCQTQGWNDSQESLDAAQHAMTQRLPLCSIVFSNNLEGRILHDESVFTAASSRQLGVRYADACIGHLGDDFEATSTQKKPIEWQYIDSSGIVRGPYSTSSMLDWYKEGYLKPNLRVRCVGMNEFVLLQTLGDRPFDASCVNVNVERMSASNTKTSTTTITNARFSTIRPTHIFILLGGSNMKGEKNRIFSEDVGHSRVFVYSSSERRWICTTNRTSDGLGSGPGRSFGKHVMDYYLDNTDAIVGLIPIAIEDSSIDEWIRESRSVTNRSLRSSLLEDAIKCLEDVTKAHGGKLTGILWHQGEADCNVESSRNYAKKLEQVIARFRETQEEHVPFLIGQMKPSYVRTQSQRIVNDSHKNIASKIPRCYFVQSHFLIDDTSRASMFSPRDSYVLGKRYARQWVDATKKILTETKMFSNLASSPSPPQQRRREEEQQNSTSRRQVLLSEMDRKVARLLGNKCPDIEIRLSEGIVKLRKRIHFLNNRAIVAPESQDILKQIAVAFRVINTVIERDGKRLGLQPLRFEIAGHTHTSRAKARNSGTMRLSRNRAKAVRDFMIKLGADMNQFECQGYGGTEPLGTNPEFNRRVEIRLLNKRVVNERAVTSSTSHSTKSSTAAVRRCGTCDGCRRTENCGGCVQCTIRNREGKLIGTCKNRQCTGTRVVEKRDDLDERVHQCLMALGDIFSWYAALRFPNDIYSMAVSSFKECLIDCGWLEEADRRDMIATQGHSPITMTTIQQLLRTFSIRAMPGSTELYFGTFVEILSAVSAPCPYNITACRHCTTRASKSLSISSVLRSFMQRGQSSSISRAAHNAQSRRILTYFVSFVESFVLPKAWKRIPVPRSMFVQVGTLNRSVLNVLQTLFLNFSSLTSTDGGLYSVSKKMSVMSWEQFLMFSELVGLIKSQLIHVSDVAEVFVSTSKTVYKLVDERTHLEMIRTRLRRNGRREKAWNDQTTRNNSSYSRKSGSRLILTRERELNFDGFVEALLRLSVPVHARSSNSQNRDEFQHFHRRQDILHKHADAIKQVPVMDRMRTVLVIVSSYLIKSSRGRGHQSRLASFPDVSLSDIGYKLMELMNNR